VKDIRRTVNDAVASMEAGAREVEQGMGLWTSPGERWRIS